MVRVPQEARSVRADDSDSGLGRVLDAADSGNHEVAPLARLGTPPLNSAEPPIAWRICSSDWFGAPILPPTPGHYCSGRQSRKMRGRQAPNLLSGPLREFDRFRRVVDVQA